MAVLDFDRWSGLGEENWRYVFDVASSDFTESRSNRSCVVCNRLHSSPIYSKLGAPTEADEPESPVYTWQAGESVPH